jgi:ABC-2 type transport system permease protein
MFIWLALICGLIVLNMALFEIFLEEGILKNLEPLLNQPFLAPMLKGFGLEIEKLSNILGFYVIRNSPLIILLTGMFSILTSISLFANEEFEKTAEFLYTRPITRSEIFVSKVLACITLIFIMNTVAVLTGYISLEIFKTEDYEKTPFFIHSIYGFLTSLTFASIGFVISAVAKRGRGLFALSVAIVMGTYFLDLISKVSESTAYIGFISPFHYVDNDILVPDYTLNMLNTGIFVAIVLFLTLFSYLYFLKKDILN